MFTCPVVDSSKQDQDLSVLIVIGNLLLLMKKSEIFFFVCVHLKTMAALDDNVCFIARQRCLSGKSSVS